MTRGLQAQFGEPLGAPLLGDLRALGISLMRADLQSVPTVADASRLLTELLEVGAQPLAIIRPEQATWLLPFQGLDVEVLNEPDLSGWHPASYALAVQQVYETLADRHHIWAGSVSNCSEKPLVWLGRMTRLLPSGVGLTVHRYPRDGARPSAPQSGYKTRMDEVRAIRRMAGDRAWGVSEWGYHTGEQKTGWWFWTRRWHWTDAQVAGFAREEWQLWEQAGATFAIWYQLNDGVRGDPVDCFGIRHRDGSWKPVAETFAV